MWLTLGGHGHSILAKSLICSGLVLTWAEGPQSQGSPLACKWASHRKEGPAGHVEPFCLGQGLEKNSNSAHAHTFHRTGYAPTVSYSDVLSCIQTPQGVKCYLNNKKKLAPDTAGTLMRQLYQE